MLNPTRWVRRCHVLLAAILALPLSTWVAQATDLPDRQRAAVEKLIGEAMDRNGVPGITVAVGLDGELAWTAGYGMADLENSVLATSDTLIRTASISKWLTATAAMRLVEGGRLDLDASPQDYCAAYPRKQWAMKVRQLLNHTAGVRHYHGSNGEPRDTEAQRQALAELRRQERIGQFMRHADVTSPLDAFKEDPLIFEPGTHYRYTSHGYRLLGCVLEGAAGQPYSALMSRLVLGPAQMADTKQDDAWAIIPHRAAGYASDPEGRLRRADFRDVSENLPAGGHLSTARDLVRFALAFNAGKLVGPDTIRQMVQPPALAGGDARNYYGLGVRVKKLQEGRMLTHDGAQAGTSTCLQSLPDARFAVAVMMNKEGVSASDLCDGIRELLVRPPG